MKKKGKSEKTTDISFKDIHKSAVLLGNIEPGKPIWTGVIDSGTVDECLVEDSVKRDELKKLIQSLEKLIQQIRQNGIGETADLDYFKVLSNKIFEIIMKDVNIEIYLVYIIKKYDLIKATNASEFRRISKECKKQIEDNRKIFFESRWNYDL